MTAVSPSQGSVMGGTLLTIHGRFFDQTDEPARVLVGGKRDRQGGNFLKRCPNLFSRRMAKQNVQHEQMNAVCLKVMQQR